MFYRRTLVRYFCSLDGPSYEPPLVHGPSPYPSPNYDMLSTRQYSIRPHHRHDSRLDLIRETSFELQHNSLLANVGALSPTTPFDLQRNNLFAIVASLSRTIAFNLRKSLFATDVALSPTFPFVLHRKVLLWNFGSLSPTIPFRPVRVPTFPAAIFSIDAGAYSERKVLPMVDWSTCPVRIIPLEDRLFANINARSPTIMFRPARAPPFPAVIFRQTMAPFQSPGCSICLSGRLALVALPLF